MTAGDRTDAAIQQDVLDELEWDPEVDVTEVGVTVVDGIVTLTGTVDNYVKKLAAERAAQRIRGVRAVANDILVKPAGLGMRTDTEIARDAAAALETCPDVPPNQIRITVKDNRILLEGDVRWEYQRAAAERCLRHLTGVKEIINLITIKPEPVSPEAIKEGILRALVRRAEVDAERIEVQVDGHEVRLLGTVRSHAERQEAEAAAWKTKGVARVINDILVEPQQPRAELR